jgi:hypothetical protein
MLVRRHRAPPRRLKRRLVGLGSMDPTPRVGTILRTIPAPRPGPISPD